MSTRDREVISYHTRPDASRSYWILGGWENETKVNYSNSHLFFFFFCSFLFYFYCSATILYLKSSFFCLFHPYRRNQLLHVRALLFTIVEPGKEKGWSTSHPRKLRLCSKDRQDRAVKRKNKKGNSDYPLSFFPSCQLLSIANCAQSARSNPSHLNAHLHSH